MTDPVPPGASRPRSAVTAAIRAAAILAIATGLAGAAALLIPALDERWIYVAAIVAIAEVEGIVFAAAATLAAPFCYEAMAHGSLALDPKRDFLLLGASVIAALAGHAAGRLLERSPDEQSQTLFEPQADIPLPEGIRGDEEAEELRTALRAGEAERRELSAALADARNRIVGLREDVSASEAERQSISARAAGLDEERATAITRVGELESELKSLAARAASAESELLEAAARITSIEARLSDASAKASSAETQLAEASVLADSLEKRLEHAMGRAESAEALLLDSTARLDWTDAHLKDTAARAESAETQLAGAVERTESLAAQLSDVSARAESLESQLREMSGRAKSAESQLMDAVARHESLEFTVREATARAESLETQLGDALGRARLAEASLNAAGEESSVARSELDALRGEYEAMATRLRESEEQRSALERDGGVLAAARASFEGERDRLESDLLQMRKKLNDRTAELESLRRAAESERVKAEEEITKIDAGAAALAARVDELEARRAADAEEHQRRRRELEEQLGEARDASAGFRERIEEVETALALAGETHLAELAKAAVEIERAEQQAARLAARIRELDAAREEDARDHEELRRQLEDRIRSSGGDADVVRQENVTLAARLDSVETALASSVELRERLELEMLELREEIVRERRRADEEAAARQSDAARFDQKLATITAHLASDHEEDLGHTIGEREEARALARKFEKRAAALESTLTDARTAYAALQKELEDATAQLDEERARADREAALRRQADSDWEERLQTIVAHLATDHESDMGQSLLEKEEAKAENRRLAMKLTEATRAAEKLHAEYNRAVEEWTAERESLNEQLKKSSGEWSAERESLVAQVEGRRRARTAAAEAAASTELPAATPERRVTVLLVHRDATLRMIARQSLEESGYAVTTAGDGLEAFRVALAQRPDVVLAESRMPKMDGRELVQLLKSRAETARVKIVLMAASADANDAAADFRADDFLRDPANIDSLKSTLEQVLVAR